jgi:hypothetical protein
LFFTKKGHFEHFYRNLHKKYAGETKICQVGKIKSITKKVKNQANTSAAESGAGVLMVSGIKKKLIKSTQFPLTRY